MSKKNIPYFYKKEYYVEKIPLYLRQDKEDIYLSIFSFLENSYLQLEKLEQNFLTILLNSYENKEKEEPLSFKIFNNSKEQIQLSYYLDKYKKELKHGEWYYRYLVHVLNTKLLISKNDWKSFLFNVNLLNFIRFRNQKLIDPSILDEDKDKVTIILNSKLDPVVKIIFKKLIKYNFRIYEIKEQEWEPDWLIKDNRNLIHKFNKIKKNENDYESKFNNGFFYFDNDWTIVEEEFLNE